MSTRQQKTTTGAGPAPVTEAPGTAAAGTTAVQAPTTQGLRRWWRVSGGSEPRHPQRVPAARGLWWRVPAARGLRRALAALALLAALAGASAGCKRADDGTAATRRQVEAAVRRDDFATAAGLNQALINSGDKAATKRKGGLAQAAHAARVMTDGDYAKAKARFTQAEAAATRADWALLAKRAAARRKVAAQYARNVKAAKAAVQSAQQFVDNGQPARALPILARVLTPAYDKPPYRAVVIAALRLKNAVQENLAASGSADGSDGTASTGAASDGGAATAGDTEATQSSAGAGTTADSGTAAGGDTGQAQGSGESAVSAAAITQARKQLKQAGVDPSFWSDQDIATAVRNARKAGRSVVTEADLK